MILEFAIYEAVTTVGGLLGLKLWADKKYLNGINQPKSLPIDRFIKRYVGKVSKTEQFISIQAVKLIQNVSRYQSFRYLLIMLGRKVNERNIHRGSFNHGL